MNKRKWLLGALVAAGALFGSTGAQAAFLLENWSFNASGVDGLPANSVYDTGPLDAWAFIAHFQQNLVDDGGTANIPDAGDTGIVNGVGFITAMVNDGSDVSSNLMNDADGFLGFPGFEVTFDFQVDYLITAADATDANFVHTAPTNATGLLNIYIDNLDDGVQCSTTTGLGCTDGELVGTFLIQAGGGGAFVIATIDGSDDATFEAIFLASGIWFDENGVDLACDNSVLGEECNGEPLLLSDSNLDSDPDGNNQLDTDSDLFDCGLGAGPGGTSLPGRTCGSEDGSVILKAIPEPASLAIFAIGLMMLGTLVGTLRLRAN